MSVTFPLTVSNFFFIGCGAGGEIRTHSGISQQIYSLPRLSNFAAPTKFSSLSQCHTTFIVRVSPDRSSLEPRRRHVSQISQQDLQAATFQLQPNLLPGGSWLLRKRSPEASQQRTEEEGISRHLMVAGLGIEPRTSAYETDVLPLHYPAIKLLKSS